MTEREEFEAWIDKYSRLDKTYPMTLEGIRDAGRELSWNAWQASRKQALEESRVLCVWIASDWACAGMQDKADAGNYLAEQVRSLTPPGEAA